MTDFNALIKVLSQGGVEFILVGGVAAAAYGSSRLTLDLDIVYRRGAENIARVVSALAPHSPYLRGAPPGLPFRWDVQTIERGLNFTLTTALGSIDLLGEIAGGGNYEDLLPHTVIVPVYGIECLCLTLEHLIHVKRAAGRFRDLEVAGELETILEEKRKQRPSGGKS